MNINYKRFYLDLFIGCVLAAGKIVIDLKNGKYDIKEVVENVVEAVEAANKIINNN